MSVGFDRSWEGRLSRSARERDREVVLKIGSDVFTKEDIGFKFGRSYTRAASILGESLRRFKPESIEEVSKRLTVEKFFAIRGVGPTVFQVWLDLLSYKRISVYDWLNNDLSVPQMYEEARVQRKLTRRSRRR